MGSIPDEEIGVFNLCNPSSPTKALGFTHALTEMSTRNLHWAGLGGGVKARQLRKAEILAATCEPIV
jgi:hypothetical protein